MIKQNNKRGKRILSVSEITILVRSLFAFSYLIYSSIGIVSGAEPGIEETPSVVDNTNNAANAERERLEKKLDAYIAGQKDKRSRLFGETPVSNQLKAPSGAPNPTPPGTGDELKERTGKAAGLGGLWKSIGNIYGYGEEVEAFNPDGTKLLKPGASTLTNGGMIDSLVSSASWGLTAGAITYGISTFVTDNEATRTAATVAVGAGVAIGRFVGTQINMGWGIAAGVAAGIIIFLLLNKKEKTEVVRFECLPWSAKTGGVDCDKCNKQGILPCSKYQCKSLGQGCELVNEGTASEACVWVNPKDVTQPVIVPWTGALFPDYSYKPDNTISPPDRGTFIKSSQTESGCVKAFTSFQFGVTVVAGGPNSQPEPAKCKLDYERKPFEEMRFFFNGSSLLLTNHSQVLSLPGPNKTEAPTINNDENYNLYVTCEDANGNPTKNEFVFKFCVDKGPDTTAPLIVSTNLINNMPVAYNTTSLPIEVYVNEPSTCKWSFNDLDYKNMENSMACNNNVFEMNAQMLYKCSTTLTGLKDRIENKFYFRCQDQPTLQPETDRNPNAESYVFKVIGTQPLVIESVKPNETIRDSTNVIKVMLEAETSAGYKEGESNCYYSETGEDDSYILFNSDLKYNTFKHSQEFHLAEGDYHYFIKCIDLGGNTDTDEVTFRVESDREAPIVTRIYHDEENHLRVLTDEKAECVYGRDSCSYIYSDGTKMTTVGENYNEHYTDWNINLNYFIKCQDEFGNQPLPNACSIIARPFSIA